MVDQRDDAVRKGAHGAWPLHDHSVFPVTYRKALLEQAVTTLIEETAAEIADQLPIERDAMETDQHLQCASESGAMPDGAEAQAHHSAGALSPQTCGEAGTVRRKVLERRGLGSLSE